MAVVDVSARPEPARARRPGAQYAPTRQPGARRSWLPLAVAIAGLVGPAAILGVRAVMTHAPAPPHAARPAPPPVRFAETDLPAGGAAITADEAVRINAAIPLSTLPVRAAAPFRLPAGADHDRAVGCLTQAIYFEAGFEPREGQEAVAQVILNRVRHPAFPKTVCGVVFEGAGASTGCQFTFACDGAMNRTPAAAAWARSRAVAMAALDGHVQNRVGEATHYHADYVAPYWGRQLAKVVKIGAHIFYRWPGAWGEPQSFVLRYAGHETPWTPAAGAVPAPTVVASTEPEEPHAPDDVGGRVELGHGWTPAAAPPVTDSLAKVLASQGGGQAQSAQASETGRSGS